MPTLKLLIQPNYVKINVTTTQQLNEAVGPLFYYLQIF